MIVSIQPSLVTYLDHEGKAFYSRKFSTRVLNIMDKQENELLPRVPTLESRG